MNQLFTCCGSGSSECCSRSAVQHGCSMSTWLKRSSLTKQLNIEAEEHGARHWTATVMHLGRFPPISTMAVIYLWHLSELGRFGLLWWLCVEHSDCFITVWHKYQWIVSSAFSSACPQHVLLHNKWLSWLKSSTWDKNITARKYFCFIGGL